MIRLKKITILKFLTVLLLYLTIINNLQKKRDENNSNANFVYENNFWMLNNQVYQYSSHLFVKTNKMMQIDSLIITDNELDVEYVKCCMRCVLKSIKAGVEIQFNITIVFKFLYNILRVKCDIEGINSDHFEDSAIAIIDLEKHKSPTGNNDNIVNFQIPNIVEIPNEKLRKIAHCVHYSYQLIDKDIPKILSWLKLQKDIGISKIVLYDSSNGGIIEKSIRKMYEKEFVEVRPYSTNYESICNPARLNEYRSYNFENYEKLKDICEHAYYSTFNDPWSDTKNRWKHQKISANDCYTTFEHVYEFVSYYDFDEIIFPRSNNIDGLMVSNKHLECENSNFCKGLIYNEKTQNLYEFIKRILPRPSNISVKIASIYFENGFYFMHNYYVEKLMNEINGLLIKNLTFFNKSYSNKDSIRLHFKFTHKIGHYFYIYPKDFEYIHRLYNTYKQMDCIYQKVHKTYDPNLESSFNRYFFLKTNSEHQLGKAVFITDNVQAVHTHFPQYPLKAYELIVNTSFGISSHFRYDYFKNAKELNSSIVDFKIDIEYYLYLVSKYSNVC